MNRIAAWYVFSLSRSRRGPKRNIGGVLIWVLAWIVSLSVSVIAAVHFQNPNSHFWYGWTIPSKGHILPCSIEQGIGKKRPVILSREIAGILNASDDVNQEIVSAESTRKGFRLVQFIAKDNVPGVIGPSGIWKYGLLKNTF